MSAGRSREEAKGPSKRKPTGGLNVSGKKSSIAANYHYHKHILDCSRLGLAQHDAPRPPGDLYARNNMRGS
jgi:hypothetical protein